MEFSGTLVYKGASKAGGLSRNFETGNMDLDKRLFASLSAAVIGDALGVPVEHATRQELALTAVKNMLGYGRYDQPKGTWSDDSSMILCTMESLCEGYDLEHIARNYCRWIFEGHWTPHGYVFDSGLTTFQALEAIWSDKMGATESGRSSEDDNGNGSLMRVLPSALYFANESPHILVERMHEISAITHSHPRSLIGCGIYGLFVKALLECADKKEAYQQACSWAVAVYESDSTLKAELMNYMRILSHELLTVEEKDIKSTGYVVHTLEAAVWCFMNSDSTKDILLSAVNLGLDTDTTGTVAGGLAGLVHGIDSIPRDWIETLARREDIEKQIAQFVQVLLSRLSPSKA